MANYSITNGSTTGAGTQQATATTYVGPLVSMVNSATVRRIKLYDILIGTNGTPADNFMEFEVQRVTAASSLTILAANALDPADAAALTTCAVNSSLGGTVATGQLFYVGINQRASYRWVAAPGSELVGPATSSAGLQLLCRSAAYTGTATGAVLFQEQ